MAATELTAILDPLSFVVEFALQRGNVCNVLSARQIVWTGRWFRLRGLLLTSAWGFAILMPIAWFGIEPLMLGKQMMPGLLTVAAGVLYAIGCFVNGACIFSVFIAPSDRGENIFPDAAIGPSGEAIVYRYLRAVIGRAVRPSPTQFQKMHDAAQDAAIIDAL
jgi:hypothetical protein